MRHLGLFAGIEGFGLAAKWMGWRNVASVEWDEYCQKVLAKNHPETTIYSNICEFDATPYHGKIDIISGGFPCQPFSAAGKRKGTADERYLWPEMLRVIREVAPRWVVAENVSGLLSQEGGLAFERVCVELENEGYEIQPYLLPAASVGAPHRRDRIWIVAHAPHKGGIRESASVCGTNGRQDGSGLSQSSHADSSQIITHACSAQPSGLRSGTQTPHPEFGGGNQFEAIANSNPMREPQPQGSERNEWGRTGNCGHESLDAHANKSRPQQLHTATQPNKSGQHSWNTPFGWDDPESWLQIAARLCRMDDGLPAWIYRHRRQRLKALGNSIVPQVAYQLFRGIEHTDNQYNHEYLNNYHATR